jgi:hypothetical protein
MFSGTNLRDLYVQYFHSSVRALRMLLRAECNKYLATAAVFGVQQFKKRTGRQAALRGNAWRDMQHVFMCWRVWVTKKLTS